MKIRALSMSDAWPFSLSPAMHTSGATTTTLDPGKVLRLWMPLCSRGAELVIYQTRLENKGVKHCMEGAEERHQSTHYCDILNFPSSTLSQNLCAVKHIMCFFWWTIVQPALSWKISSVKYVLKGAATLDAQLHHCRCEIFPPPHHGQRFSPRWQSSTPKAVLFPQVSNHSKSWSCNRSGSLPVLTQH